MTTVRIYYRNNSAKDKKFIDYAYKGIESFLDDVAQCLQLICLANIVLSDSLGIFLENNKTKYELIVYDEIYKQPNRKNCALLTWRGTKKVLKEDK